MAGSSRANSWLATLHHSACAGFGKNLLKQITDLAGVRIITYLPSTVEEVNRLISDEFEIVELSDKGKVLIEEERFGYQSVHYLVRLRPERARLAEYERFTKSIAEIQVRTILQHAWAEIEHNIQYKSSAAIPLEIRRRFMAVAGVLEIADREFQTIQDEDRRLAHRASEVVEGGDLSGLEITPAALEQFLNKKLGSDSRISDWTYDFTTRLLKNLGFRDLKQVESAIAPYKDDELNAIVHGSRQGQVTRLELMLLAALGDRFIDRHPWRATRWFGEGARATLAKLRARGVEIGTYDPLSNAEENAINPR
jgi:putative GTP pyrophosphokinase